MSEYEDLHKRIMNESDMLVGCSNRMCVTDDIEELMILYEGAVHYAFQLFDLNLLRLRANEK